jgi:hypothetical protein
LGTQGQSEPAATSAQVPCFVYWMAYVSSWPQMGFMKSIFFSLLITVFYFIFGCFLFGPDLIAILLTLYLRKYCTDLGALLIIFILT